MENNLKSIETSSLVIITIITSFFGTKIYLDYISILFLFILGLPILFIIIKINNYEKDLNINQKIIKLFGKYVGSFINIIIFLLFLIYALMLIKKLINFVSIYYLNNTPIYIISISFILITIYASIKGITTISRLAFIIFIINIFLFTTSLIHLLPDANYNNLSISLNNNTYISAIKMLIVLSINMFTILIIPKNKYVDKQQLNKWLIIAYITSIIIIFLISLMTSIWLNNSLINFYPYPEYTVLKKITLFNFLNRVENIIAIQWINGLFINISLILYYLYSNIKKIRN